MNDTHEVISAFLDDEPFDAGGLATALSDPAGRAVLIDLVALRHVVQPDALVPPSLPSDVGCGGRLSPRRPVDAVVIPPDKETGCRCTVWDNRGKQVEYSSVALRVSVRYRTWPLQERRLMGADLWLIERCRTVPSGCSHSPSGDCRITKSRRYAIRIRTQQLR